MAYPSSFQFKDGHVPPAFAPSAHIFYGESIVEVDDGVPVSKMSRASLRASGLLISLPTLRDAEMVWTQRPLGDSAARPGTTWQVGSW